MPSRPIRRKNVRVPVKIQIESGEKIGKLEQAWGKNPRGDLRVIGIERYPGTVHRDDDLANRYKINIHTHIIWDNLHGTVPSWQDLEGFMKQAWERGTKPDWKS